MKSVPICTHSFSPEHTVVLATRNPGKIRELAGPLAAFGLKVIGLDAFPEFPETPETGTTFAANAQLKADAAALATGLPAVADDSGLAVDALNGKPGVYSARYWQPGDPLPGISPSQALALTQDQRNNIKLLAALTDVPEQQRTGRFCCAMCAVRCLPDGTTTRIAAEGQWEGRILHELRGEGGFGYDPLFFDTELGQSSAEMPREIKMQRSHRARALKALLDRWTEFWKF